MSDTSSVNTPPSSTMLDDTTPQWQNRRRMAYISLFSMIFVTAWAMSPWIDVDRLKALESVLTWFYTATASIIAGYMVFTTWAYIKK